MSDARKHTAADVATLRFAIITVSDTRTLEDDRGGNAVAELASLGGHEVVHRVMVRDDSSDIAAALGVAIGSGADVVIATGGTGIAPRDVTFESLYPRLEKKLEGFGEAFRRLSFDEIGPAAVLSRAFAGTSGRALVFVLPGSEKAVRLAMERLILPIAQHAVGLLRG